MAYPERDVIRSAVLTGQSNGKLSTSILVDTPGLAGGPVVRLVAPAARAWRALTAAALKAGHTLKATSLVDSYRPYEVQANLFASRYTRTSYLTSLWWDGSYWVHSSGAAAAIPGTSNHGWGLAVDTGEERDGDAGTESLDAGTLDWLVRNEVTYGWSHELQSEPWHLRYWAGDAIPAAVLQYEESDMAMSDDDLKRIYRYLWYGDVDTGARRISAGTSLLGAFDALGRVEIKLDTLLTAVGKIGTSDPGVAAILAGMDERLAAHRAAVEADTRDAVADAAEGGAAQVRADVI